MIKDNNYDVVITKSSPSELIGYWLRKNKNIKWLTTWNDPFPIEKYPEPYGKGPFASGFVGAKKLIPIIEKYPDFHIFPSDRLRNYMLQYLNVAIEKTQIIAHVSFNEEYTPPPYKHKKSRILKILHSGNVNYPRNPFIFLEGLHLFFQEVKNADLQVDFLGVLPIGFNDKIKDFDLQGFVNIIPPVQYADSIMLLQHYDIAMLIEAPCKEGIFLPTKVGDYMQSKKTIFAVSPTSGVLHDLYSEGYVQYFANCEDAMNIKEELKKIYLDFVSGELKSSLQKKEYMPDYVLAKYQEIIEI